MRPSKPCATSECNEYPYAMVGRDKKASDLSCPGEWEAEECKIVRNYDYVSNTKYRRAFHMPASIEVALLCLLPRLFTLVSLLLLLSVLSLSCPCSEPRTSSRFS